MKPSPTRTHLLPLSVFHALCARSRDENPSPITKQLAHYNASGLNAPWSQLLPETLYSLNKGKANCCSKDCVLEFEEATKILAGADSYEVGKIVHVFHSWGTRASEFTRSFFYLPFIDHEYVHTL